MNPSMLRRFRSVISWLGAALILVAPTAASAKVASIAVDGNRLVDGAGRTVQLRGVNRSGTEYACSARDGARRGFGIFDGPTGRSHIDDAEQDRTLDAMESWGINAVRVPLSDACWFGGTGLQPAYTGTTYQAAILRYVDQLAARGMVAILSLHVASTGVFQNVDLRLMPMPDATEGPRFWRSVVESLGTTRRNVVYDAFNEPYLQHGLTVQPTSEQRWPCWRDGGCLVDPVDPAPGSPSGPADPSAPDPTPTYTTAGMQEIVDEIRARERQRGAPTRPILLGGLRYANDLSGWLKHVPRDPAATSGLVAAIHAYADGDCRTAACWDSTVGVIRASGYPVVAGEIGQYDCRSEHIERFMDWADAQGREASGRGGVSYLAWTWNAVRRLDGSDTSWRCASSPSLLETYLGAPTEGYGGAFCRHLRNRQAEEGETPGAPDPCPDPADPGTPANPGPSAPDPVPGLPTSPSDAVPPAGNGALSPPVPAPAAPAPATPAPAPPATRPGGSRTARVGSSTLRLRKGRVAVVVGCPKGSTSCAGRVKVRTRSAVALGRRRAVLVLVNAPYRVRAGTTATLRVRPTKDGVALLRRTRRIPAVATSTSAGGLPSVRRLTLSR